MNGYHLQCTEIITLQGVHVQFTLSLVTEELEERVVHVAGWAAEHNSTPERLLLRLNGKRMFLMLPQELLHGAESTAVATMLVMRRRNRIMMMMTTEELLL